MGPLILLSLGIGGTGFAYLARVAPYRPVFVILAVVSLGYAHYRMEKYPMKRSMVAFIWTATIVAVLMNLSPVILNMYYILSS
ncbi:putative mercuric transport protein, selenocysteine-containing [Alkaliphilus metalliredigens QYMF]|uniref:Mercuric transport protein MerT n=1 Tax=Alkaliphilus metalliredigens (strain QYMF) TaxID=293826 RepID=A6TMM7_ALKMQ|nr:putative mercuric transport protein, selenocysteine-containing [Alkaliphilus metalliredigens QYMF]